MKYTTYETLKAALGQNTSIAADMLAFDAAMSVAQSVDPLGVSILRTCLLVPQLATLSAVAEEQLDDTLRAMADCLKADHGLKPYAVHWAVNAWCSALGRAGFYTDSDYLRAVNKKPLNECIALAERNDAYAAYCLAYRFGTGQDGVTQVNDAEMRKWENLGAELMYSAAIEFAAMRLEEEENYDAAFAIVSQGYAFSPDPSLLGMLGDYYMEGHGCTQNYDLALNCFMQGLEHSKDCLWGAGVCYSKGYGCEKDFPKAYGYFCRAAEMGQGASAKNAFLLINDKKVEATAEEAFRMCKIAVDEGYYEMTCDLALMYIDGTGTPQDKPKAIEVLRKAAEAGDPASMGMLGRCCLQGVGTASDSVEAVRWLTKGADNDDLDSCIMMCRIALSGIKGYPMHKGKGFEYAARARDLGAREEDLPEEVRQISEDTADDEKALDPGYIMRMATSDNSPLEWKACGGLTVATANYIMGLKELGKSPSNYELRLFWYLVVMNILDEHGDRMDRNKYVANTFHTMIGVVPNITDKHTASELIDEYCNLEDKLYTAFDEDVVLNGMITVAEACGHKDRLKEVVTMAYKSIREVTDRVGNM